MRPIRIIGLLVTSALVSAAPAQGATSSLPGASSGHRPGPDALYQPAPTAPQLENTGPWNADPILVSGTQAYRDGEWLYQDYLYDDHGASGSGASNYPYGPSGHLYSPTAGTFTYPTDPVYANNAADLVELRVKPLADATAFRVTLNTLKDPARTAFTIALGDSGDSVAWPFGAGVSSPAKLFVTVHGDKAELTGAQGAATATTDLERRQIEVRIPHSVWDPGTDRVRTTVGVGLWDQAANQYLVPQSGDASETTPGGASPLGTALVNVGPRFDEPWPVLTDPSLPAPVAPTNLADSAVLGMSKAHWWREKAQADALQQGDVSPFHAEIDFSKLAAQINDDSGVPKTGPIDRIMASAYSFGQGLDPSQVCFDIAQNIDVGPKCHGRFIGNLQPYAIYVPKKPQPANGYGLSLLLHSLSANYNQYADSRNQSQVGERGAGSIVVTPAGRGPDGFYQGVPEADTFEVWADVARRYKLDPDWTIVTGYSMGGFGTYRLLARWPDLFARGFSVVGIPGAHTGDQLPSLRDTPILAWNAGGDELVNTSESEQAVKDLTDAGLRFQELFFPAADHLTLATNDWYMPGVEWLGNHRVELNPPHVTYVVDPKEDSSEAKAVGDHAYWTSGLAVRDPKDGRTGTFDARSDAFGVGDAEPTGVQDGAGTLEGGYHGPMAYRDRKQDWKPAPHTAKADRLVVNAANISTATVDARRAGLSCAPELQVKSDGPLDLKINCSRAVRAARCGGAVALKLPRVRGQRIVVAKVVRKGRTLKRKRGRNLRSVKIRRVSRRAFSVRIVMRTSGKGKRARRITVTRRIAAC
jgi:hypothetical protein